MLSECEEYKKLTYETVHFGGLTLDESAQELKVSQCDLTIGLIVGGVEAKVKEFPHMAAIAYQQPNGGLRFGCGASLISERFLLSAAHCKLLELVKMFQFANNAIQVLIFTVNSKLL